MFANIKPARRESVQVGLIVPRFNKEKYLKLNCTMAKLFEFRFTLNLLKI